MRLYRALLHLYPASFRAEYGEEMCAIFARRTRDAVNAPAVLALWMETLSDVLLNAAQAHLDIFRQDLRYAARTLCRAPGFALTAILVAALGIGANTAVFSITDQVLIRSLPFPGSQRMVKLWQNQRGYTRMELSPANYRDWKRMSTAFEAMPAYRGLSVNLVGQGDPERLEGASVTADLFPMLGAQPALGRLFTADDDRAGATDVSESDTRDSPYVAVVSESFVRRYWPGENPLRLRFRIAFQDWIVIGVVGDIRVSGLERSSEPQVYLPYMQVPDGDLTWYAPKDLVIRSSGDREALLLALRRIIRNADPDQPISDVRMLS